MVDGSGSGLPMWTGKSAVPPTDQEDQELQEKFATVKENKKQAALNSAMEKVEVSKNKNKCKRETEHKRDSKIKHNQCYRCLNSVHMVRNCPNRKKELGLQVHHASKVWPPASHYICPTNDEFKETSVWFI